MIYLNENTLKYIKKYAKLKKNFQRKLFSLKKKIECKI